METLFDSSSWEIHGVVANGMETGVILLPSGPKSLETKLDLMEVVTMVFSGWTSMISRKSMDFGPSINALKTQNTTTLWCTVAIKPWLSSVIGTSTLSTTWQELKLAERASILSQFPNSVRDCFQEELVTSMPIALHTLSEKTLPRAWWVVP